MDSVGYREKNPSRQVPICGNKIPKHWISPFFFKSDKQQSGNLSLKYPNECRQCDLCSIFMLLQAEQENSMYDDVIIMSLRVKKKLFS